MSENDPVSDQRGHRPGECEFAVGSRLDLLVLLRRRASALLPQEQLRFALEFALQHSGPQATVSAILGALAAQANDWRDWESYNMAETGVLGLVLKLPDKQEEARIWHARRHGYNPTQDAISIFDLSAVVEKAAKLHPLTDPLLESKGPFVVRQLRDYLIQRFGEKVPALAELEDWISRYGASVRSRLTTKGIVSRILHHGRLLGARGTLERTIKRVDNALARRAGRPTKRPRKKHKVKGRRDRSTHQVE